MGLAKYIIRRAIYMVPLIIGISLVSFLVMYAAGDPIQLATAGNPSITEAQRQFLREYYGLNDPIPVQYLRWLDHFIHGDFGRSLYGGRPVNEIISSLVWETAKLQLISILLAFFISIPAGVYSAVKQRSAADYTVSSVAIFGISVPVFWFGIVLILIFSYYLGWLPSAGAHGAPYLWPVFGIKNEFLDELAHLVLPVTVLTFANLAYNVRLLRAGMLEVLRQDYILAARASGIPERKILYKYALKNAITPLLTLLGLSIGAMLAGAPVTETVFSWPGLGRAYVTASLRLDFPLIMGITMIITIMILIANLVTDLIYAWVDPRVTID
ncbi:MAG: ABC transporter permease [Candidatus Methanomethylicia archaeon]|nr:ABC transporter permease [Candidatus Methanomethylicia archaeon]MCQ5373396.1 ABC transporter permease [Candidatus Methanomethylicia archaeon]